MGVGGQCQRHTQGEQEAVLSCRGTVPVLATALASGAWGQGASLSPPAGGQRVVATMNGPGLMFMKGMTL